MNTQTQPTKTNKSAKKEYIIAIGRRKEAVARVRVYEHVRDGLMFDNYAVRKGEIVVNGKAIAHYFPGDVAKHIYTQPLRITNAHQNNYAFTIRVVGGGLSGQLQAVVAGISNALNKIDKEKYRPILKKKGLLTRDARVRERRSVGTGGKARRTKQSPKR